MIMIKKSVSSSIIFVLALFALNPFFLSRVWGQASMKYNLSEMAQNKKLLVYNREITAITDGKIQGIHLSAKENDGFAWLEEVSFSDGIIELDMKGKNVLQQSFIGIAFHGVDETTFDAVYFRPFNFQSSDAVRKIHAVQYVSPPEFDWSRLRQDHNGEYEKSVNPVPDPERWFHVKIMVTFPKISVFVNESREPSLKVNDLNDRKTGKIGLWVGNNSDGNFANLTIQNNTR
jgi:hypothetical protein